MLSDSGGKKTKVLEPYDTFRRGLLESFAAKPSEMKKRMDKDWQREERERGRKEFFTGASVRSVNGEDGWVGGWVGGCSSCFKLCPQVTWVRI